MKIPLNWLNELVTLPKDKKVLTDALTSVGHMLDKVETINGETVLDLELRGNRADCYCLVGIAREVSAIFNKKVKYPPTIDLTKVEKLKNTNLRVTTPLVERVGMVEIHNIKITKSPDWLSKKLAVYGIDSVNNIVDLTNYVMLETGEPMHTFDLNKIGKNLEIRLAKDGEKITTFQDLTLTLTKEDLVWAKEGNILSVAGAVGEKYHSISETTKNVLLEAANYDRANIRRTVYRHNLLTEAGIRHEKELDPNLVEIAIGRFLYLLKVNGWGEFKPEMYDYYPKRLNPWKVKLDFNYLKRLGGVDIEKREIKKILSNLNFKIIKQSKDGLEIEVPTYRTDVTCEEDLIEEVLRIYGYDKIPTHTLSLEIPKNITPAFIKQEEILRNSAVASGFDEIISQSFVKKEHGKYNLPPENLNERVISILNPPSPDIKNLRQTLLPNLLENCRKIINERGEFVQLFEIGKVYSKSKNSYFESRKIGFIHWEVGGENFQKFKGAINTFFTNSQIDLPDYVNEIKNLPLAYSYNLILDNKRIGFGGKINDIFYAEIALDGILGKEKGYLASLWPKFPPQIEDLTLTFPPKTRIGDVSALITNHHPLITNVELRDTYQDSYTFRIWYQDPAKTLTDKEVEKIRNNILQVVKTKYGGYLKN
jgi:phenylalanyl-tRNA synthetase beta chain